MLSQLEALAAWSPWWEAARRSNSARILRARNKWAFSVDSNLPNEKIRVEIRPEQPLEMTLSSKREWPISLTDRFSAVVEILDQIEEELGTLGRQAVFEFKIGPGLPIHNDERPSLVFSSQRAQDLPVPDFEFLQSDRYSSWGEFVSLKAPKLESRLRKAYWRGSLNCQDRIDLLETTAGNRNFNVKGTQSETWNRDRIKKDFIVRSEPRIARRVPLQQLAKYSIQIQVDGIAAAYKSEFTKFMSGSPVVKIRKSNEFRTWLSPFLDADIDHLSVVSGSNEVLEAAEWLLSDPVSAARMAKSANERVNHLREVPLGKLLEDVPGWLQDDGSQNGLRNSEILRRPLANPGEELLVETALHSYHARRVDPEFILKAKHLLTGGPESFGIREIFADVCMKAENFSLASRLMGFPPRYQSFTGRRLARELRRALSPTRVVMSKGGMFRQYLREVSK